MLIFTPKGDSLHPKMGILQVLMGAHPLQGLPGSCNKQTTLGFQKMVSACIEHNTD